MIGANSAFASSAKEIISFPNNLLPLIPCKGSLRDKVFPLKERF
jgi:hypothetical protein